MENGLDLRRRLELADRALGATQLAAMPARRRTMGDAVWWIADGLQL